MLFLKKYNTFLRVTTFMNQARDMMIAVTGPTDVAVIPPLFIAEANLIVAANEI